MGRCLTSRWRDSFASEGAQASMATPGDAIRNRRLEEAREYYAKAEKELKTGIFKWSKDYTAAARAFENAGSCFQNANCLEDAKRSFGRAAHCQFKKKDSSPFFAAKQLESAAIVAAKQLEAEEPGSAKKAGFAREVSDFYLEANTYYQMTSHWDRAAECIHKAAKICEADVPEVALTTYMLLGEVTIHLDKAGKIYAMDALRPGVAFAAKVQRFDKALELLQVYRKFTFELEQTLELCKACLTTVIMYLAAGDGAGASSALESLSGEYGDFSVSEDYQAGADILAAYADKDDEELQKLKKGDRVMRLDQPVVRCMFNLHVDGATVDAKMSNNMDHAFGASGEVFGGDSGNSLEEAVEEEKEAGQELC